MKLLQRLKKLIKKHGVMKVFSDMGYTTPNTYAYWLKLGRVPDTAQLRVKKYLDEA